MNFDDVHELLLGIEQGNIGLRKSLPPKEDTLEAHYGIVQFVADSSWVLGIFFDCGEWDYIDHIVDPDGNRVEYDDLPRGLMNYLPSKKARRDVYNSPGYLGCFRNEPDDES